MRDATGEMHYVPTTDHDSYVSLPKDPRTGIGYVHQTPWITQGTVRVSLQSCVYSSIVAYVRVTGQHRARFAVRREAVPGSPT